MIAAVLVAGFLVIAIFGLIGAAMVGPVVRDSASDRRLHWIPGALAAGLIAGQVAAFVSLTTAALTGWPTGGVVLGFCLSTSALAGASGRLVTERSRG